MFYWSLLKYGRLPVGIAVATLRFVLFVRFCQVADVWWGLGVWRDRQVAWWWLTLGSPELQEEIRGKWLAHRHETGRKAVAYDLMGIANGHFTLFIKLQEVCGLCKGSFLPIERSSKKSRDHYEVITRSFIFPYLSISFLPGPIDATSQERPRHHGLPTAPGGQQHRQFQRRLAQRGAGRKRLRRSATPRWTTGSNGWFQSGIMWNITMNNYE